MSIFSFDMNPRAFPDFDLITGGCHKAPSLGFIRYQLFERREVFFLDQGNPRTAKPCTRQPGTETRMGSFPAFIQKIKLWTGNLIIISKAFMGLE